MRRQRYEKAKILGLYIRMTNIRLCCCISRVLLYLRRLQYSTSSTQFPAIFGNYLARENPRLTMGLISRNFWPLSFTRKSTVDRGISLNSLFSHSTYKPNLRDHQHSQITHKHNARKRLGWDIRYEKQPFNEIPWSSVGFLVKDYCQKLQEIVSMMYYTKDYVSLINILSTVTQLYICYELISSFLKQFRYESRKPN